MARASRDHDTGPKGETGMQIDFGTRQVAAASAPHLRTGIVLLTGLLAGANAFAQQGNLGFPPTDITTGP